MKGIFQMGDIVHVLKIRKFILKEKNDLPFTPFFRKEKHL
jgi:hypothetical protein